jgi:hypothetical protein
MSLADICAWISGASRREAMLEAADAIWVHSPAGIAFREQQVTSVADEYVVGSGQSFDDPAYTFVCAQARALRVASEATDEHLLFLRSGLLLLRLQDGACTIFVVAVDPLTLAT